MNNLIPVNFNNEIVITTKMLAEVYGCKEQQITQNFNYSQDKFEEKKHYYKLTGEELKEFKRVIENSDDPLYQEIKFASVLILWTKRGASRHCKMLGTDRAWDMFDSLEENYFNPQVPQLTRKQELQLAILNGSELERVGALKEYEGLITQPLIEHIDEIQPKADWFEEFMNGTGCYTSTQVAKMLHISSAKKLNDMLKAEGIIFKQGKNWFPYATTDDTWFKIIVGGNNGCSYSQLKFTPKGVYEISKLLDISFGEEDLNLA